MSLLVLEPSEVPIVPDNFVPFIRPRAWEERTMGLPSRIDYLRRKTEARGIQVLDVQMDPSTGDRQHLVSLWLSTQGPSIRISSRLRTTRIKSTTRSTLTKAKESGSASRSGRQVSE